MKIFTKLLLLSFVLVQASLYAQVDVTATGGTLTATYTTLNDAFAAINLGTHTGTIDVAITGNTTEPTIPTPLLRSNAPSSYTSITIKPSGGNWVINSAATLTANRGIVELQGADNVTIDGDDPSTPGVRNLTFESITAAVASACIRISSNSTTGLDGADNITVKNVNINGARLNATATTVTYGINISNWSSTSLTTGAYSNLNTVLENNNITRCYRGIYANGANVTYPNTGLIVRNNVFGSSTVAANNIGNSSVYLSYTSATAGATSATVEGNTVRSGDVSISGAGFSASVSGIEIAAANPGAKIRNNSVVVYQPTPSGYGAYGVNISSATSNNDIEVYNNMITVGASKYSTLATSSFIANGIRVSVAATLLKINYNTIYVPLHTTGTTVNYTSHGIFISSTTATVAESRNNLIVNDNVGTGTYCMYLGAAANISAGVVNYNNYSAPSGNIGYLTAAQTTLAAWQTATSQEANSVNSPAVFVSPSDLHADITNSANLGFMTAGTPIATITTDIDGQTRSVTTPSIGADEFLVPSCAGQPSAGVLTASANPICVGSSSLLTATAITSTDGAGTTYQWYESNDSITFTAIPGATGKTYNYANAPGAKYFTFVNTCANSSLADTSRITINLINPTYVSVPYFQSFDNWISVCGNTEVPGTEWRNNPILGNNSWRRQDQGVTTGGWSGSTGIVTGFTGTGAANFHTYNSTTGLIGQLDLYYDNSTNPDPVELQFDHLNLTGTDSLFVLFSSDNGANFTQLAGFGTAATWTKRKVDIGVVFSPQCVIRLQARSDFGSNDIGVDNLHLVNVCAGAPTAGTITAAVNPICPNTSASLSLTGATLAGGLTYQWLTSTDGITYSFAATDTNATLNTVLPDSTYFRAVVSCGSLNDTTPVYKVTMKSAIFCYCALAASSTTEDDIGQVQIGSLLNPAVRPTPQQSNPAAVNTYTDFTALTPTNLQPTVTYPATVYHFHSGTDVITNYSNIYIDFNQNGLYTDPGETFPLTKVGGAFLTDFTGNISIPLTATPGLTGMRVILREGAISGPCGAVTYGEIEDYIVNILPPPACSNPPAAGNAYGVTNICNGTTTALVDTGYSLGTSLQWQTSTDGTTWTNFLGAGATTAAITSSPLVDSAFYRLKVTCVDSSYSNVLKLTAKAPNQCYCTSTSTNLDDTRIDSVFFSTVVAGSPSATCQSYTDNTSLIGDITQLVPFTLRVRNGSCDVTYWGGTLGVYIDYNQDGDFLDAGEAVNTSGTTGFNTLVPISITPPASAALGQTRMRLVLNEGGTPSSCGTYSYGETEDYTVNILPAPPCVTPSSAGTITGPATAQTYTTGQYIVTGAVGTIAWQYAFNPAGPFTQLIFTTDTINVGLNFVDTVYIRIVASSPGCPNDTTLVPFQTVAYLPGNNVCDAVPLTFGANGPYITTAANTQVGEPTPTGWISSTLSNTLWFTFTAPASGRVSIQSPDFDTQLGLWDALNCDTILIGGATQLASSDDDANYVANGGVQYSSFITASCLTPGKTYYVQLDPYTAPGDTTRIILTDLGAINTSFTLDTAYCAGSPVVNLNPATAGGTFTGTGVSGTTFSPTTAGVGGPYTITYKIGVCDSTNKMTSVIAAPTATSSITNVLCNGASTGIIDVTISGTGPFTSSWSNGAATEDLTGLAAGTYADTIKNTNGCSVVLSALTVTQPTAIAATLTKTNVLCNGGNTGSIIAAVSGGTAPYSYSWSNAQSTDTAQNLVAGIYTVTVVDNSQCSAIFSDTITQPSALLATLDSSKNVTCNGGADGVLYVSTTGGVGSYSYAWSNGSTTATASGLAAGTYMATVTDANACSTTVSGTITEPAAIVISLDSIISPLCNGDTTGGANITVTGGTSTFSYAWSNGSMMQNLVNVTGGSYTVTATDASGCTATATANITQPATLLFTIDSFKTITCNGANDGKIYTTLTGGTAPYNYVWNSVAATGSDPTGLPAGSYSVVATDANQCTVSAGPVIVTVPLVLSATVDSTRNAKCAGQANGAVFVSVAGGTTPYTYLWSTGATSANLLNVVAGTYTYTVTDKNGCTTSGSSTVTAPTAVVLTTTKTNEFQGGALGTASVTATGGVGSYTYAWSNGATTAAITGLIAGTYNVTVTDANGCTATSSAVVSFVSGVGNVDLVNAYEVYPNPTSGKFQIAVELAAMSDVKIEIVASNGQLVKVINEKNIDTRVFDVDQEIAAGLYFVKLSFGDTQVTKRINVIK